MGGWTKMNERIPGEILYTDLEWAQVQLAWALINGYKSNKGVRGYEDDYWRGKSILDDVARGKFKDEGMGGGLK